MKKLVTFFLALVMPIMLWAYDFQSGDLYYNITSDVAPYTVEVTNPKSSSLSVNFRSVAIPATVEYNNVIYTVTRIGDMAFYLPEFGFFLTSITIPNTVTSIGDYAFCGSVLLTSIIIPNSVTSIGFGAFSGCWGMSSLVLESGNIVYDSRENCNAIIETATNTLIAGVNSSIIPNSVTTIGSHAFYRCEYLTSVTLPNSVTSIGDHAFSGCKSLSSITIPNSVTNIGDDAFSGCKSLSSITLPNSVTNIGDDAFSGCDSLSSIIIPNSVTSIGDHAFSGCKSLSSITIPNSVESIGAGAFFATGFYLDETNWKNELLYCCNCLIAAKDSIWGSHVIESNTRMIADFVFEGCESLSSIIIPNSVTSIGDWVFTDCKSLSSITLPNSVTSIGDYAFSGCESLSSITIPNSVESIGKAAFINCRNLDTIYVEATTPPELGTSTFAGTPSPVCHIPCGTKAAYEASAWASQVGEFVEDCVEGQQITYTSTDGNIVTPYKTDVFGANIVSNTYENGQGVITFDGPVTSIGASAFSHCFSLNSITIPNSVTSIGSSAFEHCNSLTSVTIGNSVTSIGSSAFYNCSSLTSLTIPNSVTSIIENAFSSCSSLTSIVVEASNTTFDSRENCNAIIETETNTLIAGCQRTIIPNSITRIGDFAFYNCFSLTSITIPNSVTNIGNDAFRSCSSLASITIPNSVTSIGEGTFAGCSSLISVTIGNSVTSIGRLAFYSCSSIDTIHVEATTPPTVDVEAFLSTSISTCYIPCGTLAAYQASDWANYVGEFVETYEYTLILSSSDNSMGSATITQEPACGTPAIIVATPNVGYHFSQWSDGNTDNPRTLTVSQDMELTAQWTPNTNIPYIVKHYRQALDGTYPSAFMETENLMGTTAANVTPVVKTYTGFTSPVAKTATIAADGSTVVEYYYTRNKYTLTWVTDGNALTGAYSKGSVLFEAAITRPNTPTKTGYTFAGWDNTVPATMPAENLTLTALFTIHTYSVILTADQNGTVSGGGTYNYGESVTITATPNDGYTFSQWSDGNTDNPRTLTVTEDIELTAEFEEEGNYGSYSRTVRIGYNTICLPHGSSHFTGATFYEIAHILKNDKKIFFDEAKTLEAGKPYIFYPHSTEVTIYYDNTTSAIPLSHNGLHGTFDGITAASNFLKGKYLVAGNRMVLCGDGCSLAANRAYIVLDEISDKDHPAIPGIKRVSMDYSEENATTALDNITDESIVAPMQEGVYDILGRKVDAPTVSGFYIINGKKVFVMEK